MAGVTWRVPRADCPHGLTLNGLKEGKKQRLNAAVFGCRFLPFRHYLKPWFNVGGHDHENGYGCEGFPHHGDDVHANDRVDDHRSCARCRAPLHYPALASLTRSLWGCADGYGPD